MGLTPLFTRTELGYSRNVGEMMSWTGDRLNGWCAFISGATTKTQTKSPYNISGDYGAQLWPLSSTSPHSSVLPS